MQAIKAFFGKVWAWVLANKVLAGVIAGVATLAIVTAIVVPVSVSSAKKKKAAEQEQQQSGEVVPYDDGGKKGDQGGGGASRICYDGARYRPDGGGSGTDQGGTGRERLYQTQGKCKETEDHEQTVPLHQLGWIPYLCRQE